MTTKEVCRLLGITQKALRVYEENCLLAPERGRNNYRNYSEDDTMRLRTITLLRELGLSLKEIKSIIKRSDISDDYLNILYMQYRAIDKELNSLKHISTILTSIINQHIAEPEKQQVLSDVLSLNVKKDSNISLLEKWDFDQMATNYFESYLHEDTEYSEVLQRTAKKINMLCADGSILDVGVGTGILWEKAGREYSLTVLDKSLIMLRKCMEKLPWAKPVFSDILFPKDDLGTYDLVVSTYTLHHIPYEYQLTAINNIILHCKKGGHVILADRNVWDKKSQEKLEKRLHQTGRKDRIQKIRNEFYLQGSKICRYLDQQGLTYCFERYGEETLLIDITK